MSQSNLKLMDVKQLRERLHVLLVDFRNNVGEMAAVVKELADRGEDLSEIPKITKRLLLHIAEGRIPAQFYWHKFAEKVATFAEEEERVLVLEDRPIEVLSPVCDGSTLMMQPSKMPPEFIRQVFARDHIRDDAEQRAYLESKRVQAVPSAEEPEVKFHPKRGLMVRGSVTISPKEILRYASMIVKG